MEKVYIVTSGEYSDYTIQAVFSTREKAEEYVSILTEGTERTINEWELDGIKKDAEPERFEAIFDYDSGKLLHVENKYWSIYQKSVIQAIPVEQGKFNLSIDFHTARLDAIRKIASEIFMQVKAMHEVKFPYLFEKVVENEVYLIGSKKIIDDYPLYNYETGHILFKYERMRLKEGTKAIAVPIIQ